jgi:hypothetical protein
VGAMRAALDAAQATIDRFGADGKTHLIPRLAPEVWTILDEPPRAPVPGKPVPPVGAAPAEKRSPVKVAPPADSAPAETPPPVVPAPAEKPAAASPQAKKPRKRKS